MLALVFATISASDGEWRWTIGLLLVCGVAFGVCWLLFQTAVDVGVFRVGYL
jgi:hypothetical protein